VRGYSAASSWGRTWYEHMLEIERRRLIEVGKSPAEVNTAVKVFVEFHSLYLMKVMMSGQVITQHPEWKSLWYDSLDGQYGRPAAFYQQVASSEPWRSLAKGERSLCSSFAAPPTTFMSQADSEAIAQIVNQVHHGHTPAISRWML
jgi:hypothetical protein